MLQKGKRAVHNVPRDGTVTRFFGDNKLMYGVMLGIDGSER